MFQRLSKSCYRWSTTIISSHHLPKTSVLNKRAMSVNNQLKFTISENGRKATTEMNDSFFQRKGYNLAVFPDVVSNISAIRQSAWRAGFLDMNSKLRVDGMTFLVAMAYDFKTQSTEQALNSSKFLAIIKLGHVGTQSFETHQQITENDGNIIIHNSQFWVSLNRKSRKVSSVPDWFKNKFVKSQHAPKSEPILPVVKPTEGFYTEQVTIDDQSIDHFGHTNHLKYMEFAVNASLRAVKSGSLDGRFQEAFIVRAEVVFDGESNVGDVLDVAVWQNTLTSSIHAQIDNNGKPIVNFSFSFDNCLSKL